MSESQWQVSAGRMGQIAVGEPRRRAVGGLDRLGAAEASRQVTEAFDRLAADLASAQAREGFYEALIANASEAIIGSSLQGIVTRWNPAAEAIFGYAAGEMIGRPLAALIPDDRLREQAGILERVRRNTARTDFQTLRRRRNGELFQASVTVFPAMDHAGAVIGACEMIRDISELARNRQALERAEGRYELVMTGMSVGVWDWDLVAGKMVGSDRLWSMLGVPPREDIRNVEDFTSRMHPDDRQEVDARLRAHLKTREKFDMAYRIQRSSGHYAWIHATGQAVWDAAGKAVRMAGSIEDITQHNKLERDLFEMVDKLKKSNKDLDEFAYAASHDLKAPLRVIDNTSQWLLEDLEPHLTPETRENMTLLRSRVKRMEKLLGDLLEYSRIGRAQDERYAELVQGHELLENILAMLSPGAGFSVTAEPRFLQMRVRRMPLQQVLMNLIGNAIKHHDKQTGSVKLALEDAGGMVAFCVEDDGPGVPAQFHDKVFEMFRTLKPRDQVEGSGMGLAMVRKNVEMLGGEVSLQSVAGEGARFRFTWPRSQLMPVARA